MISNEKLFFGSSGWEHRSGSFNCIDALSGKEIWKYVTGEGVGSEIIISNDKVIFFSSSKIYCLNGNNGEKV
jgi:outer membrane protein assembly factor BamB